MDALLSALQKANSLPEPDMMSEDRESTPEEDLINHLACDLFVTSKGQLNHPQVNEFERYAPCKISICERDNFGPLMCCIKYGNRRYYFG